MNNDLESAKKVFEERCKNPEDGTCEIDLTHPLTPEQVLAVIEAHTAFEKRMSTDSYVELTGPMTPEEVHQALDKLVEQCRKK